MTDKPRIERQKKEAAPNKCKTKNTNKRPSFKHIPQTNHPDPK